MNIAHLAIVTPRQAGLYETAREIVAAERALGHNAFILDPSRSKQDRGVPIGVWDWNMADIVVSHSGLNGYGDCPKPVVYCLHGRPESSFLLESNPATRKKHPVYSLAVQNAALERNKAFVTFWLETVPYWELLIGKGRVASLTPPVDLKAWSPDGPRGYSFHGQGGKINVVITDMWRDDKTPFHCIHGFLEFADRNPGAKLHIYGVHTNPAMEVLCEAMKQRGVLGEVMGIVSGLDNVYRAADVLISPHRIATRAIREALACGCPVVHAGNTDLGGVNVGDPEDLEAWATCTQTAIGLTRTCMRSIAVDKYDSMLTGKQMIQLCEGILNATH